MKLSDYLVREQISQSEFARIIGRSHSTVSRILRGKTMPDHATMRVIMKATNGRVRPNDFFEAPK